MTCEDPRLAATVVGTVALRYREGADASLDRPAHVRAGSALVRVPNGLAVVQDDANFVAIVDPRTGLCDALPLPALEGVRQFDKGRENKHKKLDLEAAVAWPGGLVAFGSGSSPLRRQLAIVELTGRVRLFDATALYDVLAADRAFSGSELNLEGAVVDGPSLRLFQRGNGATIDGREPVDATVTIDLEAFERWLEGRGPVPTPGVPVAWDLGRLDGVRLTFADADVDAGCRYYLAAAERSPNAIDDGPVLGMAIGRFEGATARWAALRDPTGALVALKGEGLIVSGHTAFVVVDADDPDRPSELLTVALSGPWDSESHTGTR